MKVVEIKQGLEELGQLMNVNGGEKFRYALRKNLRKFQSALSQHQYVPPQKAIDFQQALYAKAKELGIKEGEELEKLEAEELKAQGLEEFLEEESKKFDDAMATEVELEVHKLAEEHFPEIMSLREETIIKKWMV